MTRSRAQLLLVALAVVLAGYVVGCAPIPYTRNGWVVDGKYLWIAKLPNQRHRIGDWLHLTGGLDGLTKVQVLAKLGEPGGRTIFRDWSMHYWLGDQRSLVGLDSEWLLIRFDPISGLVTATDVRTD
jgi:hypothetical protein